MEYKPKVITGKVTGTGWPIDGHVLWFSQWDYDNRESWHLYGWEDSEDEAVMQTVFQTETEAGLCLFDTLEKFAENWKAKKWEPQGSFCLPLDKVEVLEVKQEESTNNTRRRGHAGNPESLRHYINELAGGDRRARVGTNRAAADHSLGGHPPDLDRANREKDQGIQSQEKDLPHSGRIHERAHAKRRRPHLWY